MRVLICGDRSWTDRETIEAYIKTLPPRTIVIQGKCRGADWIARTFAIHYGHIIKDFPARWELYGKGAGSMRNKQMLTEGKPDLVVAFHNNLPESKGTKDMIMQAKAAGIPTEIRLSLSTVNGGW
jgi:hypothetical protein